MVKNECDQSGFWTLKLPVSQERTNGTDFLHAGTILHQLKGDWKFLVVSMVKNGCGKSGDWNIKLTVSEECTDGIN